MSLVVQPSPNEASATYEFSVVVTTPGTDTAAHLRTLLAAAQAMKPEKRTFELLAIGPAGSAVQALESQVPFPYTYCSTAEAARTASKGRWLLQLQEGDVFQYPQLNFAVGADSAVCPPFTAHNIGWAEGMRTRPGQEAFEDGPRERAIFGIVDRVAATRPDGKLRLADLGSLEMGFAVEAARRGHQVLALEGRQSNIDRFRWLEKHLDLPNLEVACDDVRNVAAHGQFDVVLCLGLLYHLDKPRQVLEAIAASVTDTLVLDTHVAIPNDPEAPGPIVVNEDVPGRWVGEFAPNTQQEQIDRLAWCSLDNPASFWIEPGALRGLLHEMGFPLVLQVEDVDPRPNRNILIAFRNPTSVAKG